MNTLRTKILTVGGIFLSALVIAFILVSCGHEGVETNKTNNPDMHVTLLFEHDGCKIYRFTDAGEYIYYADCRGSASVSWNELEGKIVVPKQVQTEEGK